MRFLVVAAALVATPVVAQDSGGLADIRQELSVLYRDIETLRRELTTTSVARPSLSGGGPLERIDAIERELRRLTGQTEALEIRIDTIVSDGTNRIGDLEFRVCELEPSCDIATYEYGSTLGGVAAPSPTEPLPPQATPESLAVSEQADFTRAKDALDAENYAQASDLFSQFLNAYPNGPLSAEAQYFRGEALAQQEFWREAARSYLDAFSIAPDGPRAPESLLRLGVSLGELDQRDEACLTLSEVGARFPAAVTTVAAAEAERSLLQCF